MDNSEIAHKVDNSVDNSILSPPVEEAKHSKVLRREKGNQSTYKMQIMFA